MNQQYTQSEQRRMNTARYLAAELVQRNMDVNLIRTAEAYVKVYPDADIHDWLYRLAQLGDLFSSSEQTGRHRHELMEACKRLSPQRRPRH